MKFVSTRGKSPAVSFSAAIMQGLAPDGGLYVPESFPKIPQEAFDGVESLPDVANVLLRPFVEGDAIAAQIPEITRDAFNFPAPLAQASTDGRLSILELFHGPTAAFKDFGARFLAACMARLRTDASRPLNILVATSGDTGGAVAAAFHRRPGVVVSVLFPKGLVSPTQEQQLTCWGDNVHSFRVAGTFDDCQRLVKEAFLDPTLKSRFELSSANSINLGRLLPQAVYYAATSLAVWREQGRPASYIIPSGNLGNSMACLWARALGLPIGRIVLAHNANRTVPDFLKTGVWEPRPSVPTLASAMDVGTPSNMERMRSMFPDIRDLREAVSAMSVSDDQIRHRIAEGFRLGGGIWCPHTATAVDAYVRLTTEERHDQHWVIVSTAHAAKFREIVEPLIGQQIEIPESLAKLFSRPASAVDLQPELAALIGALEKTASKI